jgi:hypothetical protein
MTELADPATAVEQFDCPMCEAPAGSTCRTRGGKVAPKYGLPVGVERPTGLSVTCFDTMGLTRAGLPDGGF